jgi:hypothetical protein
MKRLTCLLLLAGGCFLDEKPPPCQYANTPTAGIADILYRDPANGQCESFGNPYPCDNACGPCPGLADVAPDWGICGGSCSNLNEMQCLAQPNCHVTYQDDSAAKPVFWGCWDMPPSGVVHGSCTGLDAQTCSEHDDCFSLYTGPVNQPPNFVPSFESCQPEIMPAACSTLTTETDCLARTDCDPIYTGMNCTCDPHGCQCQTETFDHCK